MEYETLKTFVELAQIKNFTKAAEKLHVVQTTVSSRISVLEKELGTALFERTNKQVRLTKQGELFLPYAQRIIDLSDESAYQLKTSLFYKHYLTIGGIDIIWRIGLSALISEYLVENPNVAINSETYSSKYINELLIDRIVDVAFVASPPSTKKFEIIPAFSDEIIFVASPKLPISEQRSVSVRDLQKLPVISGRLGGSYVKWFDEIFPTSHELRINMDITSLTIPFLASGIAPGLILRKMVTAELAAGSLIEIPLTGTPQPPIWKSYMIFPSERKSDPVIQDLIRRLTL